MAEQDDVSEIRSEIRDFRQATTASFNVLNDLRATVDTEFERVDRGFTEIRGKLDASAAGQQQIVNLLNTLIAQDRGDHPDPH